LVEHTAYSARSTLDGVIRVTKGDVITIPANTPHWFKEIPTQTIAYRP
jgi:quercetin dioxygenase-like cupin family protein